MDYVIRRAVIPLCSEDTQNKLNNCGNLQDHGTGLCCLKGWKENIGENEEEYGVDHLV